MMGMILAQEDSTKKIFGEGITGAPLNTGTVSENFSNVFGFFLQATMAIAALFVLYMVITGAIDWISSSGEPDKLKKAQAKILNALVGVFILVAVLIIWVFVGGRVLGILGREGGILQLKLPSVRKESVPPAQVPNMPRPGERPIPIP
jgi:MFS superfamily sulfate permease-like transporter